MIINFIIPFHVQTHTYTHKSPETPDKMNRVVSRPPGLIQKIKET